MTDAKEWVTVKVPVDVRDAASDHPDTYEDIMRAGIHALREDLVRVRNDNSVEVLTETDDTAGGVGNLEPFGGKVTDLGVPDDDLREQLDRIERAANTVEDRTGRIERTLENLGGGQ